MRVGRWAGSLAACGALVALGGLAWRHWDEVDRWMSAAPALSTRSSAAVSARDLRMALKMYETEVGDLPPAGNAELVRCLSARSSNGDAPYLALDPRELSPDGEWTDPWGRPWIWERPAPGRWTLVSPGPNGRRDAEGGDDLVFGN
ncbi:MAG: type II secretion system protein GspG [Planctomycetia bacterium]|nr:type II secretion system protein GspG [Planctomycetia bacterium]